jgi:hypothetical protein
MIRDVHILEDSMENDTRTKVHLISIYPSKGAARPIVHTVRCRRCGVILERTEEPLSIGVEGWYAVSGAETEENIRVWKVDGPHLPGMSLCDDDAGGVSP